MGKASTLDEMNPHIRREDTLGNPQLWVVKYRTHPKNDKLPFAFEREIISNEFGTKKVVPFMFLKEPYSCLTRLKNLYLAWQKGRQCMVSEFNVNTALYICDTHTGVAILYILQDERSGKKFVKKRVDSAIDGSPYIASLINSGQARKGGREGRKKQIDSLELKKFGNNWFYMLHSTSDNASRSPDADIVIFDEYDAHDKSNETSFRQSASNSEIRAFIYTGTPTLPDFGIDKKYKSTSMGQWTINCANCLDDFVMDSAYFFGDGVKILPEPRWTDGAVRIFVCPHCGQEVKTEDKQLRGRYVHAVPELIKENRIGFKISQLIMPHITADRSWADYQECLMDPKGGGRKLYVNECLGEATMNEEAGARFTRAAMQECYDGSEFGWVESARGTMVGVDWGTETHVVVWKRVQVGIQLLNYHVIPSSTKPLDGAKEVAKLILRYNPTKLVCDFGAGQEQNKYLYERFSDIFYAAVNHKAMKDNNPQWNEKKGIVHYDLITVYSSLAYWFAANMVKLPAYDAKLELFIQHCLNSFIVDPNARPEMEGMVEHLALVPETKPKELHKKGPIHLLSAALFGFLDCMGSAAEEFSCSEPTYEDDAGDTTNLDVAAVLEAVRQIKSGRKSINDFSEKIVKQIASVTGRYTRDPAAEFYGANEGNVLCRRL